MKVNKVLALLFVLASCCFFAGSVNHIMFTHENWLSSLFMAAGCLCAAIAFYRKC